MNIEHQYLHHFYFISASVDRVCAEALLRGADVFKPGVICASGDIRMDTELEVWGDVTGNFEVDIGDVKGSKRGGKKANNRGCKLSSFKGHLLFIGKGKSLVPKAGALFNENHGVGVEMVELASGRKGVGLHDIGMEGKWFMQNLPSLLPPVSLLSSLTPHSPTPRVLDMCCAPGGKTNHLSCILRDLGHLKQPGVLTCVDRSTKKMVGVRDMLDRAGFENVVTLAGDSQALLGEDGCEEPEFKMGVVNKAKPYPPKTFTHILLDPPCSALGLRPRLQLPSADGVGDYEGYQTGFMHAAAGLLVEGGIMTWSTCTWNPNENEVAVKRIRDEYGFEVIDVGVEHGREGIGGAGLDLSERRMVRRFDWMEEGEEGDGIGFFVAKLRKL
ncbi:hypothetical protein TrCOL_g10637 [Triparma columacea]|uniref:SAM-dependent MTase RsmB/NOP-type domain-containing protein n=1 Tax=Triparma columacea TaxID=722753 RepID=A0A9W7GJT9_9STRA|nr:hypothetical protein TrCOL_g10637 [Triparma columacea]